MTECLTWFAFCYACTCAYVCMRVHVCTCVYVRICVYTMHFFSNLVCILLVGQDAKVVVVGDYLGHIGQGYVKALQRLLRTYKDTYIRTCIYGHIYKDMYVRAHI